MKIATIKQFGSTIVILMTIILLVSSCSAIQKKNGKGRWFSFNKEKQTVENPEPRYYDFKDVLVPGELTEDKRHSSIIGVGEKKTGFLAFYGRVELRSIIHFFEIKVPEDGWKPLSVIKSPFSTNMIFKKGNRLCLITLTEKGFTTEVGIGVSVEL